jgi:hypothetical protein
VADRSFIVSHPASERGENPAEKRDFVRAARLNYSRGASLRSLAGLSRAPSGKIAPMERQPLQFTIRGIALASFWLGACLALFSLAKAKVAPGTCFVLANLSLCQAIYDLFKHAPATGRLRNNRAMAGAIIVGTLAVFPIFFVASLFFIVAIGPLINTIYDSHFDDIQANYLLFDRINNAVAMILITLPYTLFSLWLFDLFAGRAWRWRRAAVTLAAWETAVVMILAGSHEIGFSYEINKLGRAIFGYAQSEYSWWNLIPHRIVAWLIETIPVAWTALWVHSNMD